MIAIRRILCPVDLSEGSRRALEHAAAVARAWGAQLTVLHVQHIPLPFELVPGSDGTTARAPDPELLRPALHEFVKSAAGDVAAALKVISAFDTRVAILTEAARDDADLLVVGTHGRGSVERFLLGSISDRVVRRAECPVLVVPPGAEPPRDGRFRRILCGIDFSPPSLRAFRYAIQLAAREGAEVIVLHAIEIPAELRDRQMTAAFDIEAVRAAAEATARQRLESLWPGDAAAAVRIATHVGEGRAHRQILEAARAQRADLIVLGTHGRGALDRWLFGSNTQAVLRDTPCPVLTVRAE